MASLLKITKSVMFIVYQEPVNIEDLTYRKRKFKKYAGLILRNAAKSKRWR